MLNRRSFLRWPLVSGLGIAATTSPPRDPSDADILVDDYERLLARPGSLDLLGLPHSWSLVQQGLHPIAPERVIVLTERGGDGRASRNREAQARLRDHMAHLGLHPGKFDLILWLMRVVTDHYRSFRSGFPFGGSSAAALDFAFDSPLGSRHNRTVLSQLHETAYLPSEVNATCQTAS